MPYQKRPFLSDGRFLRNCVLKTAIPEEEEIGYKVLVSLPCPPPIRKFGREELQFFDPRPVMDEMTIKIASAPASFRNTGLVSYDNALSPKFFKAIDEDAKGRIQEIEENVRRF
ncbi:unnamed protein product [Amoebophrya sp. A25]|nr:unnamed protein product [Amoebophrya sp. A25]|eukprot:GSA25T00002153001.1